MAEHVPSNFATYQKANGEPVFQTFFVLSEINSTFVLLAFSSEEERAAVIEFQRSKGKTAESLTHVRAFDLMRNGAMAAFLYEGGIEEIQTYTPLELAPGFKRHGLIPRVIEGGAPVVALE